MMTSMVIQTFSVIKVAYKNTSDFYRIAAILLLFYFYTYKRYVATPI